MNFRGRIKATFFIPLLITVVIVGLARINPPIIDEFLETLLTVYRFKIRNIISPPSVPDNIVIVSVDEKSLTEYGRWPWSRKLQADLIERVFEGDPKAVAVDIFYPETEGPDADKSFAEVLNKYRDRVVVALGFEVEQDKYYDGELNDMLFDQAATKIENFSHLRAIDAFRVLIPPEPIADSARFGHVYSLADRNGILIWENMYIKYGDEYFLSLAVKTAALAGRVDFDRIRILGGQGIDFDGVLIPSDEFGRLHINYFGKERTFTYKSAADLLSGRVGTGFFKDKIVFIGTSAIATYDLKNTPFSANMPGVEKNATVVANILERNFMRRADLYLDLIIIILVGFAAMLIGREGRALYSFFYYFIIVIFIVLANQLLFTFSGTRFNLVYPLLTILSNGTFIISYRYLIEEKKARDIRRMFSSYVTERVVNELIKNPEMAKLGGERREITVLFSDISGFTSYSEKHAPEEVVSTLNEYLAAMTDVVFRWEGTLDKFIGDAIVAFWGAPLEQKNHAELAVRCALNMIKKLGELQTEWEAKGKVPLNIGIGLNTGEVLVGNIGAEGKKMDYTVIGDQVNIGARVESLTRKFKTDILMTELPLNEIFDLVKSSRIGHVSIKGVGKVVVKGKEKPVKIYEIKSLDPSESSVIDECKDEAIIHMKEK